MAFEICVLCVCFVFPFESRATFMAICICILWCAYILVHMFGIIFQFEFNAYFRDTACVAFPLFIVSRTPVLPLTSFLFLLLSLLFAFVLSIPLLTNMFRFQSFYIEKEALLFTLIYSYYNHS